jgi:hypothetical protein
LRSRAANHFLPIRSFLIDSDLRQARAAHFAQNIFAHDLQCTRRRTVAKTVAFTDEKICCTARAKKIRRMQKGLILSGVLQFPFSG